jgi:hypothetical protein
MDEERAQIFLCGALFTLFCVVVCYVLFSPSPTLPTRLLVVNGREEKDGRLVKDIPDVRDHPDSVADHSREGGSTPRKPLHKANNVAKQPSRNT